MPRSKSSWSPFPFLLSTNLSLTVLQEERLASEIRSGANGQQEGRRTHSRSTVSGRTPLVMTSPLTSLAPASPPSEPSSGQRTVPKGTSSMLLDAGRSRPERHVDRPSRGARRSESWEAAAETWTAVEGASLLASPDEDGNEGDVDEESEARRAVYVGGSMLLALVMVGW